ncbi:MAG: carbohydrate kinase family protein [Planctomycetes bacterium]|nr:carbohydrate kinase family protein [Planctomycetota bacterium]
MATAFDCIVAGTCVLDIVCRPVDLGRPIGAGVLHESAPLQLSGGGVCTNAGVAMARLGVRTGVFSAVGDDSWGAMLREVYRKEHLADHLLVQPEDSTSTTVALVDRSGERSFLHYPGACSRLDAQAFLDRMELWRSTQFLLLGYYSLLPVLEADLPEVLKKIRQAGCKTALDAAGSGGDMRPLDRCLPHLDVYVPSLAEAQRQTGKSDPRQIIGDYRGCGAPGLLGVKLGSQGVLLSPRAGEFVQIGVCRPPGDVLDTTGAGDCFYAGLLAGLLKGHSVEEAGRLGAASAACCVTAIGGYAGARDYPFTARLAGIESVEV